MSKSKIEWCDYTINPVKGLCPMACSYCYARRMYKRFKWNPEVRWEPEHLLDLNLMPNGSKVFIGSTIELFGEWVKEKWLQDLFYWWIPRYPQHTFIFLTKKPENLIKWNPFPENCWVGVSATDNEMFCRAVSYLGEIKASVRFISLEPLLDEITTAYPLERVLKHFNINWLIIGQQTPVSAKTMPTVESITEIMTAADRVNIPIFLKNNLSGFLPFRQHYSEDYHDKCYKLRQEFPTIQNTSQKPVLERGDKK